MTTKQDDIPQWAWDCVEGLPLHGDSYCDDDDLSTIARTILKAKNDAYEEAATIADELFLDHTENHGDLYADDISHAIRNLKHETEV